MNILKFQNRLKRGLLVALPLTFALTLGGCRNNQPQVVNPDGTPYVAGAAGSTAPAGSPAAQRAAEERRESPRERDREQAAARYPGPPSAAPAYGAPALRTTTLPSDTPIVVRTTETLSAKQNSVGDSFSGSLEQPVSSGNSVIFPRGTHVSGRVVSSKGEGHFKGAGDLGIQVTSIGSYPVSTTEYVRTVSGKGKRSVEMIGGGAGLGAIIGGLAGGGKGAAIGAAAGAGAGTAGAAYTGNKDVVIPSESVITFRTTSPINVR